MRGAKSESPPWISPWNDCPRTSRLTVMIAARRISGDNGKPDAPGEADEGVTAM